MGVDTKAILFGAPSVREVEAVLRGSFPASDVSVRDAGVGEGMAWISFNDGSVNRGDKPSGLNRQMFVMPSYDGSDYSDVYPGQRTLVSLGASGKSVQAMEALAGQFGGYVLDADSNDDWRLVEASPEKQVEYTEADRLRMRLSEILDPKQGILIAALIDDPEKFEQVFTAISDYRETLNTAPAPGR